MHLRITILFSMNQTLPFSTVHSTASFWLWLFQFLFLKPIHFRSHFNHSTMVSICIDLKSSFDHVSIPTKVGRYRYSQHCITALIAVLLHTAKEQKNSEGNQKNNGTLLFFTVLFSKVIKCFIF